MTEPQKTLRSLGIIKGGGITFISSASMRMAGGEEANTWDDLEEFVDAGGFKFLPQSWQGNFRVQSEINDWHAWLYGTLKKTGIASNQYHGNWCIFDFDTCLDLMPMFPSQTTTTKTWVLVLAWYVSNCFHPSVLLFSSLGGMSYCG